VQGVMSAGSFQLVEILMPRETGNGRPVGKGKGWFDGFLKELTERFGGANSFLRGTGPVAEQRRDREGQHRRGRSHGGRNDGTFGQSLRERLERELSKDEIVDRFRADLRAIAAGNHIGHPVLHHDSQLRTLITLAIGSHRLPSIFKTVAVKTVMHRNAVQRLEPGKFGELVNEPGRKKDFRGRAGRPVRTYEVKRLAGRERYQLRVPRTSTEL
jgi:hypothetical protein